MKGKKHINIAINVEKAFDKIQHSFMVKAPSNVAREGSFLKIVKASYDNPQPISFSIRKNEKRFP